MDTVGRYEIIKELGRGGMAVVYLARDPYMNREVAVKVLPSHLTVDPQFRARFQREAQVIAALDHPAIVPVYDFGEQQQRLYIVMRYMAGGSLADRLKRSGSLSIADTSSLLERIGSALDEAHEKGIVHRDLKPANILFDDRGKPFVGDFGIVKLSEATVAYTGEQVIGTPGYMSPEQARGDAEIDGRSDIYALGAIVYEMLSGQLPYQADTPIGLMMKPIIEPVPNILDINPGLPVKTAKAISKAMAKEREERFITCSDFSLALSPPPPPTQMEATMLEPLTSDAQSMDRTVLEPMVSEAAAPPVSAAPPSRAVPLRKDRARQVPRWAIAIGCIGILLCGGLALGVGALGLGDFLGGDEATVVSEITPDGSLQNTTPNSANTIEADGVTPPSVSDADFIEYDSASAGIRLLYPADWVIDEESDLITIASSQELIQQDSDIEDGAAVIVFSVPGELFENEDPVENLSGAIDDFGLAEDVTLVGQPTPVTIGNQPGATVDATFITDSGNPAAGFYTLLTNANRVAIAFAASPETDEARFMPILRSIVDSISVRAPAGQIVEGPIDTSATRGVITYGEQVSGELVSNAYDVWDLIGFEGDQIDISTFTTDGDLDLIVDVLDTDGSTILSTGAVDEGHSTELLEAITLPYTGDYYIVLKKFGQTTGAYELNVSTSGASFSLSEPGSSLMARDELPAAGAHAFPFTADIAGGTVNAQVQALDDIDIVLSVHDGETDQVLQTADNERGSESLAFLVPQTGNYYFNVGSADGSSGDYEITLFGPTGIVFELASGDSVTGLFDTTSQIDYIVRAFAGSPIVIIMQPDEELDALLELFDLAEPGQIIIEIDEGFSGEPELLSYTAEEDTILILRVRGFGGGVGGFTLSVE